MGWGSVHIFNDMANLTIKSDKARKDIGVPPSANAQNPYWMCIIRNMILPILQLTMGKKRKILVRFSANAQNRYRMCTIWIKTLKRLNFLQITSSDMPHMYFQA